MEKEQHGSEQYFVSLLMFKGHMSAVDSKEDDESIDSDFLKLLHFVILGRHFFMSWMHLIQRKVFPTP